MSDSSELSVAPIRAVAFDMDGLMFNTEDIYVDVGSAVLRRRGHEPSRAVFDRMMGRPSDVALRLMIEHFGLPDTVADLELESDIMFRELMPLRLAPLPGLLELLDLLEAKGVPKAIGTGSRRSFVNLALGLTGLSHRFSYIVTSQDVPRGKPEPDTFERIRQQFGVAPRQLLVLEDSENGCRAGIAAGATVVAIPSPHTRHHDFSGVDFLADSLTAPRLLALVESNRGSHPAPS
ncbi:MAG TPA: HAD family phosphatase [Pirellulaceae bacterium]